MAYDEEDIANYLQQAIEIMNQDTDTSSDTGTDTDTDTGTDSDTDTESEEVADTLEDAGCEHYNRSCEIKAACCGEWFVCRLCHDKKHDEEEFDPEKQHKMDRFKTEVIRCLNCGLEQSVKDTCSNPECQEKFGTYSCLTCRMFDNNEKGQYHCDGCGICMVGGKDNYFHCDTCKVCYNKSMEGTHTCTVIDDKVCPICWDDLLGSTKQWFPLACGHLIHVECFEVYSRQNYKCPYCSKSMIKQDIFNKAMEAEVNAVIMPDEYADQMENILCNECGAKTQAQFHIVAMKCGDCGSYNTKRL